VTRPSLQPELHQTITCELRRILECAALLKLGEMRDQMAATLPAQLNHQILAELATMRRAIHDKVEQTHACLLRIEAMSYFTHDPAVRREVCVIRTLLVELETLCASDRT
jgi:hypothetical protein